MSGSKGSQETISSLQLVITNVHLMWLKKMEMVQVLSFSDLFVEDCSFAFTAI